MRYLRRTTVARNPIFGILPNDYGSLKAAMVESRMAAPESPFAEACGTLARGAAAGACVSGWSQLGSCDSLSMIAWPPYLALKISSRDSAGFAAVADRRQTSIYTLRWNDPSAMRNESL